MDELQSLIDFAFIVTLAVFMPPAGIWTVTELGVAAEDPSGPETENLTQACALLAPLLTRSTLVWSTAEGDDPPVTLEYAKSPS